jgi:hypothetical protein
MNKIDVAISIDNAVAGLEELVRLGELPKPKYNDHYDADVGAAINSLRLIRIALA